MDLKDIMSISGKPGLYRNVAQSKTGIIVESLIDNKRFQAFASDKISALGEISIYTDTEDMPLREVFRLIREKYADQEAPDSKATDKQIVEFFESVVANYDKERFYLSHMRKIAGWYNLLLKNGVTDFSEPAEEAAAAENESPGSASDQAAAE